MPRVNLKRKDSTLCDIPECFNPKSNGYHCEIHQPKLEIKDVNENANNKEVPETDQDGDMHSVWESEGGAVLPILHELPEDGEHKEEIHSDGVPLREGEKTPPNAPLDANTAEVQGDKLE